jgi:sulfinoalanine decarboxylase
LGLAGVESLLGGAIERRRQLEDGLTDDDRLLVQGGALHLLAFRPAALDPAAADRWSLRTRQQLLGEQLMLSRPLYRGHHHLKVVLGNPHTRPDHLERLARLVHQSLPTPGDG